MIRRFLFLFVLSVGLTALFALAVEGQKRVPAAAVRSITVISEPSAIVWIDDVRYGKTGADGKFTIKTIASGSHTLRVRADGFKETSKTLGAAQKGEISVPLVKTDDPAELAYQEAERTPSSDREKAVEKYKEAIKLRPGYARAYIGLARALSEDDTGAALAVIKDLRRNGDLRKITAEDAEASAVEGRIYHSNADDDKAIASFKRSIAQAKGFQPEAYTGLGLLYKERAESLGGEGDLTAETAAYNESLKNFRVALKQLSGAPDAAVLYQLVGLVLERQKKYADAIALYQEFLRFYPDSSDASAVQSFIDQLRKQMAEQ